MSGKPASVGAVRAGVPGAPRLLVYVEPRQLEPGAAPPSPHAPRQLALARPPLYAHTDHRTLPNAVFYKHLNENDNKLTVYGSAENIAQKPEFYPTSQQYAKELGLTIEDSGVDRGLGVNIKQDGVDSIRGEFSGPETFQCRAPVESVELASYQARCSGSLVDSMPLHQIAVHQGQNQYSESVTVHSADISSERELVGKSYVNYQILEQSVSHQSIVNQSISILNQQVGVSRGVVSESECGSPPQLVRTADGVVLAVVPGPVVAQPADSADSGRTASSDSPQTITVPLGWRRIVTGTSVLYISPSGTALSTLPQLREYLQTAGTCKCGLPCPLRPETAFSFDSKVVSKPYQVASGAELTKLCNHKRKLLATLQARGQSPATPPPNTEQKKVMGTEALKKKMKKRPCFPANVPTRNQSVSQLMVQRERPLAEFKETESRDSPSSAPLRASGALPAYPGHAAPPAMPLDPDPKLDTQIQRSSHYLTVNNGWITQNSEGQKPQQNLTVPMNTPPPVGVPVRGANGQIIGVNTCYKHNYRGPLPEQEHKDDRKEPHAQNLHNVKQIHNNKEEESQIFCGLNQPLTPEVMQKINEQQQIFIQQNQKQIEMAMKGYRNQMADNTSQGKPQGQGQFTPQGQLVIQNGAVVKTNPAKTPPWQVKRNDSGCSNSMTSPNPKLQKIENADFEESNATMSEDSSSSFSSFSSNEQGGSQGMCSRVPPLPQHYNMLGQQWPPLDNNKKKGKANKGGKKKNSPTENKIITFGSNGMRLIQDQKGNSSDEIGSNNVPSFMDDPSGYLAQQTVLLNNTISRQVGMSSNYDGGQFDANTSNYLQHHQRGMSKPGEISNVYRNNLTNSSPSPNSTPDSSVLLDKSTDNSLSQCCKGCNVSSKGSSPEYVDNQMRMKYMKHNMYKMELEGNSSTSSPKHGFDDSPVTSSTFIDRSLSGNDSRSPIQAGVVSTSNVSHAESLQPPEPSPTPSSSSRSTDTPHSGGQHPGPAHAAGQPPPAAPVFHYSSPGPAHAGAGHPPPAVPVYHYSSPGPPATHSITGTQMMHFISNHNVNKNLMEVDNISMVGVKPGMKAQESYRLEPRRRMENTMPGYCPPPHLGGGPAHSLVQACYIQSFVTTMASGSSVTRDTVTSVLAGKASTATTSINASQASFFRPPPPPSVNLATAYAIPNNQPDPFLNSVNLPTSYPLHIAGTTAQNMISKSPLEMVQNVIGSLPAKSESNGGPASQQAGKRTTPGQILISSTGQIIVSNNQMPPPPPKATTAAAGGALPAALGAPTVVVNTLPAPFVLQPPVMAVDGQLVQQSSVLPQLVAGGLVPSHSPSDTPRQIDIKTQQNYVQGVAMLSPETLKKRSKKKKNQPANVANVLQINAPQQNNIVVQSSPQHNGSPQFSPRGFQLSPNNNMSPTPVLQALTIVPGKSGAPAHIVMNGQGTATSFGSQQIIANTSPSQQINLLQPVNLINNASSVMSNFPAFQQFIVPNLGGMVVTADGATIIQDGSGGMPVQLQLQTVNGQNVLTPVQNQGVFSGANGGVVLRAQNQQGKIIQSQHSPGAQFLSPNSQMMMNSPGFNGQLSPLLANLSPTSVTFNGQRPGVQAQEFIQTNQMGPALMVPVSPKRAALPASRTNTFVQNTTIVQQQTTLVSNAAPPAPPVPRLGLHPNLLMGNKQVTQKRAYPEPEPEDKQEEREDGYARFMRSLGGAEHVRHSVSTQTLAGRNKSPAHGVSGSSPPDTTTHSPLGALEPERAYPHATYADTTTESPEPADANSSAMVQCVSSSEQDMAEARDHAWPAPRTDFGGDNDAQNNMLSTMPMLRARHSGVESSEPQFAALPPPPAAAGPAPPADYFDRAHAYKRKNDFGDGSTYRSDKIMRTNTYSVRTPKESEYDMGVGPDKLPRHYRPSGSNPDAVLPKVFDRHNLGSSDDAKSEEGSSSAGSGGPSTRRFEVGQVVWGPVRGHESWPGALVGRAGDGRWRVRWFGGERPPPPATLHAARLLTLSEGLEAHHAARTRHRKSRKLNTLLENAIQEAMSELDKNSERGGDAAASGAGGADAGDEQTASAASELEPITETPKRTKKTRKQDRHKKNPVKIAPHPAKTDARLRSAR